MFAYYHVRNMSLLDEHAHNMDSNNNSDSHYDSDDSCDSFSAALSDQNFGIRIPSGDGVSVLARVHALPELKPTQELQSKSKFESESESESEYEFNRDNDASALHVHVRVPVLQSVCEPSVGVVHEGGHSVSELQLPSSGVAVNTEDLGIDVVHQVKLSKSEWDYTEIPESQSEKDIMQMIIHGFNDVNIVRSGQQSLISFLKITPSHEMHQHLYTTFYQSALEDLVKKHRKNERDHLTRIAKSGSGSSSDAATDIVDVFKAWKRVMGEAKSIKKIDAMRIQNIKMDKTSLDGTYENILLSVFDKMMEEKYYGTLGAGAWVADRRLKWTYYYYTLCILYNNNISNLNTNVDSFVSHVIQWYENEAVEHASVAHFVEHAYDYVERNEYIHKYASMQLYEHQKQLFTIIKRPEPKLVLYIAPTGTGKTLSPLGITEKYRVVFICAARHVGIALAKAAITMKKKVAFAFGCNNIDDIRLHYFAAKEYTRDWKTGGIRKVDNSVGDNVELMICDVKSYLYAMNYMCAFNPADKLVMYWDEPTIMLDYDDHPYHAIIHRTWSKNVIPNIVLSSATLPKESEIGNVIRDFRTKFSGVVGGEPQVHNIVSHDCKKSIPVLNKTGTVELPHFLFAEDYIKVKESAQHCETYKTIMRYFDLREVVRFVCAVDKANVSGGASASILTSQRYALTRYFSEKLTDITMTSIKDYYLKLVANIRPDAWTGIIEPLVATRRPFYPSTIYFTTSDAYTLTDGPTIYLTSEVKKIAAFALQHTEIPDEVFDDIMNDIRFNAGLSERIADLERQLEDERAKREGSGNGTGGGGGSGSDGVNGRSVSKKELDSKLCINEKSTKVMKRYDELFSLQGKISELREQVKTVTLNEIFIPNTEEHYEYWRKRSKRDDKNKNGKPGSGTWFSSDVDPDTVEQIMLLPIENSWKLLLLMGIGVITNPHEVTEGSIGTQYNDIIKSLAQNQKLYLIIASSDYIYGTNYQFCHGYIGKDLSTMTQEKTVQAMGRVGRNGLQQDYTIRFRDDTLIKKLFSAVPASEKLEVKNMNRLFTTSSA